MSVELNNYLMVRERIQNIQREAQVERELKAARNQNQNQNARVFKFQVPRLFSLSRKNA
jgi:hypothetical protein